MTTRVFSGVQPTGNLHLGNYLGAIVNFVKLQATHECIYCVVDLHAITVPMSVWGGPDELRRNTREVTAAFIAAGIDPKKQIIFNQSQVAGHAELTWVFNCVARLGWLSRMTQFKEKAGKDRENASIGLYDYPVLMASDILLYRATHVPVGEDQKQHLELARDIAQKFNNDYGDSIRGHGFGDMFFPLPESLHWQVPAWPQFHVIQLAMHAAGVEKFQFEPLAMAIVYSVGFTVLFSAVAIWRLARKG